MPLSASILARLQHQHETIAELIAGLPEEALKSPVNPGKWSAFENIVHLAAYQPTFIHRIKLMLEEDEPVFERYIAENDPLFHKYLEKNLAELIASIAADRELITSLLHQLDEKGLLRTGRHKAYGLISISAWADFFLLHEAHHLWTIFQLTRMLTVRPNK
jgi:hypothetical protein